MAVGEIGELGQRTALEGFSSESVLWRVRSGDLDVVRRKVIVRGSS